ncbi:hypothetical protein DOS79_09200 [Staphylococcus felis]|nr:hypothetical protein [Staphylococcus felis]REH90214.1 hypothetical protein DOS83_12665 [Staphylococcus felis]REI27116.1 hypothetical protein DOS79_09200 [Staphylococcus felis]
MILTIANQFTDMRMNKLQEMQEDIMNLVISVQKETQQYGNKQKITNLHLNDIKQAMDAKAEKVVSNAYQLDFEDILASANTTYEIFNAGVTQTKNKRAYSKEKAKIKNAIWRLLKMHLNDLYGTSKTLPQKDYQDYMYSDMQQYIKELSVATVRNYMRK